MLFSIMVRIIVLRAVIILALSTILALTVALVNKEAGISSALWFIILVETLVHHSFSVGVWRYFYGIVHIALLTAEICVAITLALPRISVTRWSTSTTVILAGSTYLLIASLCLSWVLRITSSLKARGRDLGQPLDILCGCQDNYLHRNSRTWMLVGRSIWRTSLRGEAGLIRILRAVLAICFLGLLLIYSAFAVIVAPVQEIGFGPVKLIRTNQINDPQMRPHTWNVIAIMDMRNLVADDVDTFKSSVNVTPLWDNSFLPKPPCVHVPGNITYGDTYIPDQQMSPYLQTITIVCPPRIPVLGDVNFARSSIVAPDLLITVNFTTLWNSTEPTLIDTRLNSVAILMGLTYNTEDVIANSIPVVLFPGAHLCAGLRREIRRRFVRPPLASFGFMSSSKKTFFNADLHNIIIDPSPLVSKDADTATLRIYGMNDITDWSILEDYRETSVWGGLSAVGGFWTFVNGAFGMVFGTSLLFILFGIKPLSIFGLIHTFQRRRLTQAWKDAYPLMDRESRVPRSERGITAFLREHFIDLNSMEDVEINSEMQTSKRMSDTTVDDTSIRLPMPDLGDMQIMLDKR